MTDQNNAARPVLTDDEINAACDWPASNTTMRAENDRAMAREVEAAVLRKLSKLRAEGVQAGDEVEWAGYRPLLRDAIAAKDAMHEAGIRYATFGVMFPEMMRRFTAALASAPVAGEAQDWPTPAQEAEAAKQWDAWAHEMNQCRDASLEQAARICDAEGQEWDSDAVITEKNYAEHCARRIRALKGSAAPQASEAVRDVVAERQRQISAKGFSTERDDGYTNRELADAGAQYALRAGGWSSLNVWPWKPDTFKEGTPREMLVKAAALIVAEIERQDRAALSAQPGAQRTGGSDGDQ